MISYSTLDVAVDCSGKKSLWRLAVIVRGNLYPVTICWVAQRLPKWRGLGAHALVHTQGRPLQIDRQGVKNQETLEGRVISRGLKFLESSIIVAGGYPKFSTNVLQASLPKWLAAPEQSKLRASFGNSHKIFQKVIEMRLTKARRWVSLVITLEKSEHPIVY